MPTQSFASRAYQVEDLFQANELYHLKGWTDGLPIVPPTEELVAQFLNAGDRGPADVVAVEPTKGFVITAEKVAINAVMAGCRPEYAPVVLAAVEAMGQERFNLHAITVSTAGAAVLVVVHGPIARELGVNSGVNILGPGSRANASIGRALRLIVMNTTGARPGELDKATLGHPGKYAYCIAEAEEVSPWEPLHVERGMEVSQSAVSVFAALSPWQVANHSGNTPEAILTTVADVLKAVDRNQGEVLLLLSPEHVRHIVKAGWGKTEIRKFLADHSTRTLRELVKAARWDDSVREEEMDRVVGLLRSPEALTVLVGGGPAGGFSAIIPLWGGGTGSRSVTWPVRLPGD